jgi:pantothenate kinase type III
MAAAMACRNLDSSGSFIIIDAGTCITVDLLTPGVWHGGAILPGLSLQSSSMVHAGLPEIGPLSDGRWMAEDAPEGALGQDTASALRAGIPWATRKSVGAIGRVFRGMAPTAKVMLTGGDASHFDGLEGWRTFAHPNLVLEGGALLLNEQDT